LFFFFLAQAGKRLFRLPMVEKKSAIARHLLYRMIGSQDYETASGMKRDIFRKIIRQDLRGALPYIQLPTLVLWGKKDAFVPVRYGKKIARRIPNARIEILPEGRHGLHLQDPDHLFELVRVFVDRIYAGHT
jgi:pimeloyl-ACP methyl ester carboxylesterase